MIEIGKNALDLRQAKDSPPTPWSKNGKVAFLQKLEIHQQINRESYQHDPDTRNETVNTEKLKTL